MRRPYVRNGADIDVSRKIRETFMDRPAQQVDEMSWDWPRTMLEVGTCEAMLYSSDKWRDDGELVDYKHVAEGPQTLLVQHGFLRDYHQPSKSIPGLISKKVMLDGPMPTSFAVLAPVLGIQARLFERDEDGELFIPNGWESAYQIDIAKAWLGAAEHPETGQKFLLVYTASSLCCLVTGEILDIEKDGIVG